jgi:acetyl-CoA acetyltransferase
MNLAYLQDATSVWVLQMLEWYGFCGEGEAGSFLAEGHTRPGGSLPVNTNGGQLSECYMWNWMHLYEAVRQLRKECGDRQISGAEVALHAQTHDFFKGAASILSVHDGS